MQCQLCGEPASVHLTDIVNKKRRETHLCEACARKQNLIADAPGPQLNLQPLMQLILGQLGFIQPAVPMGLSCQACGMEYAQFKAQGRLGCPEDYDAFRMAIEPLLERIHRGLHHAGKVPRRIKRDLAHAEVEVLKHQLLEAVKEERYEDAARIRDSIKERENAG